MQQTVFINEGYNRAEVDVEISRIPGIETVDITSPLPNLIRVEIDDEQYYGARSSLLALDSINSVPLGKIHKNTLFTRTTENITIPHGLSEQAPDFFRWLSLNNDPDLRNGYQDEWWKFPKESSYIYDTDRTGANTIVFIMDTGIDETHPEFTGVDFERIYTTGDGVAAHGTYTASILCGQTLGLLPDAKLIDVKAIWANGSIDDDKLTEACEAMADWIADPLNGVTDTTILLVNMSFGIYWSDEYPAIIALKNLGFICFAAAGNSSENLDSIAMQPASTLGPGQAIASVDRAGVYSFFSGYNGYATTYAVGYQVPCADAPTGNYIRPSGTSMSTPVALGMFGSFMGGRYRPTNSYEITALVEEWHETVCKENAVKWTVSRTITSPYTYLAKGISDPLDLHVVSNRYEVVIQYGPTSDFVNVSDTNINIYYGPIENFVNVSSTELIIFYDGV